MLTILSHTLCVNNIDFFFQLIEPVSFPRGECLNSVLSRNKHLLHRCTLALHQRRGAVQEAGWAVGVGAGQGTGRSQRWMSSLRQWWEALLVGMLTKTQRAAACLTFHSEISLPLLPSFFFSTPLFSSFPVSLSLSFLPLLLFPFFSLPTAEHK